MLEIISLGNEGNLLHRQHGTRVRDYETYFFLSASTRAIFVMSLPSISFLNSSMRSGGIMRLAGLGVFAVALIGATAFAIVGAALPVKSSMILELPPLGFDCSGGREGGCMRPSLSVEASMPFLRPEDFLSGAQ